MHEALVGGGNESRVPSVLHFVAERWRALLLVPLSAAIAVLVFISAREPVHLARAVIELRTFVHEDAIVTELDRNLAVRTAMANPAVNATVRGDSLTLYSRGQSGAAAEADLKQAYAAVVGPIVSRTNAEIGTLSDAIQRVTARAGGPQVEGGLTIPAVATLELALADLGQRHLQAARAMKSASLAPAIARSTERTSVALWAMVASVGTGLTVFAASLALALVRSGGSTKRRDWPVPLAAIRTQAARCVLPH